MSLKIIRQGVLDTIQDSGRFGYRHLGINPGGSMDMLSAQLANALLGKDLAAPVIEMHFPAPKILFTQPTVICLTGADFTAIINGHPVPTCQPVFIRANSVLAFEKIKKGARSYLSVLHGLVLENWLNSYGTNSKANAGGFKGRALKEGDEIPLTGGFAFGKFSNEHDPFQLHWKTLAVERAANQFEFIIGDEWNWLTPESQKNFQENSFVVTPASDRMGYYLSGERLNKNTQEELVSSAVAFGTVQLLPNGQAVILMADHQTTGGYPRIAYVISSSLPTLAQVKPNESVRFVMTNLEEAEKKQIRQRMYLIQIQNECKLKMEKLVHEN